MTWRNWFLPHKDTHKKAHLISWEAFAVYILIFILLQVSFSIIGYTRPGVLGIAGNIDQKRLIELTNVERGKKGLEPLSESSALDNAAALKAQNMFSENYWAHFAPSGKTPWDFMLSSGYKFTFAGENLAKNFYKSDDVVVAWMNSQTHRDNLLNPKYREIGIAVVNGSLNGQQTTLVVQMFGTTDVLAARTPVVEIQGKELTVPKEDLAKPVLVAQAPAVYLETKPLLDPFIVYKYGGLSLLALITLLLSIDIYMLRKRGVLRLSSHHIAHMALLSLAAGSIYMTNPGAIL